MDSRTRLLYEKYSNITCKAFWHDCTRLAAGEPLDYVIGWTPFLGCTIDLTYRPLIPRPETEWWVEQVFPRISQYEAPRILDMGAGSGCIGTAVLMHVPTAHVTFAEHEQQLLSQIELTLTRNALDRARASVVQTNLFAAISDTFDCILTNPPYVGATSTAVAHSVTAYERHTSVFSGSDGLALIEQLVPQALKHLNHGGFIALECDPHQTAFVQRLMRGYGARSTDILLDQYGHERVVVATR